MSLWSMREVTGMTGVTESALRYYNKKGILSPTVREDSGRRRWMYDDEAVDKLKKLYLLKYIGMTAEEAATVIYDDNEFWRPAMKSQV